jgi:outer membrane receptor protein involved in Fe transport
LVNFLTNQPQTASRPFASQAPDIVNKHYLRDNIFSGYFQDDWKFRSNLSFNLGLRYEFATIPSKKYGAVAIVPSPTTIFPCGSPVITATNPCPSSAAVLAGVTQPAGDPTTVLRNTYWTHNPTKKNFEPRIGFAYQPFKDSKTVIRAVFGVFDSLPLPYELILNSTSSAPWRSTLAGLGSAVLPSPPSIQGCANSGAVAAGLCASSAAGEWPYVVPSLTTQHITQSAGRTFMYVDNNIKRNYVFQYNLNVQRQISPTLSVLVGYTGSRAFHNPFQADSVNTIIPVLIPNVGYVWNKAWSNTNNATLANLTTAAVPGFCPPGVTPCKAGDVINARRYNTTTGGMFNTMSIRKS